MEFNAKNYKPSDTLRFVRECLSLTQEELGNAIGKKGRSWARNIENDKARFYFDDFIKIAKKFDIEVIIKKP